jgi:hypothetical protein
MVGAADGLGGSVIRTVSFFGWTLPVDFFMGVTGAPGTPGGNGGCGSAICFQFKINPAIKVSNQIAKHFKFFDAARHFTRKKWANFCPHKGKNGLANNRPPAAKSDLREINAVHAARRDNRRRRRRRVSRDFR